jgi:hypothetical protein
MLFFNQKICKNLGFSFVNEAPVLETGKTSLEAALENTGKKMCLRCTAIFRGMGIY